MSISRLQNPHVSKVIERPERRPARRAWLAWAMLISTAWACASIVAIASLQLIVPQVRQAIDGGGRFIGDMLAQLGIAIVPEQYELGLAVGVTWTATWILMTILTVTIKPGARAASTAFAAGTGLTVGLAVLPLTLASVAIVAIVG